MNRVFEKSRQKGTNRLMLLCISDNADDDGLAFPGMDELASKMGGVSRRSAGNRVEALAGTAELGVYPRRGTSHDYIVFTGMTLTQAKNAIRKLSVKRRKTIVELHRLRRMFAGTGAHESSQVPAKQDSQGVRRISDTNHQEPSVEPPDRRENEKQEKTERQPDEHFNMVGWVFFGIKDYRNINGEGGRVGMVLARIRKFEPDIAPERIEAFGPWYDRETRDPKSGKPLSRPKNPEKVAEWWAKFAAAMPHEPAKASADGKPVSPLLALGVTQAELDANPGLQADLERIYREQGKIK